MDTKEINWTAGVIGALLVAVFALALPYGARIALGDIIDNQIVNLTVLALFSVIALVSAVALLAFIFAALRLTDTRHALALPQGTVRALIALSLIVIFVISAVFLFTTLANDDRTDPIEIGADQADNIPVDQIISKEKVSGSGGKTFRVVLRLPRSDAAKEFAKQIFTTISTLVIAMAGFYFGSRTVARARGIVEQATLRILSPDPGKPVKMKKHGANPLDIKLRVTPDGAAVRWDRHPPGDPKGELNQLEHTQFRYTRGDDPNTIEDKVTLTFSLVDHPDVSAALDVEAETGGTTAAPPVPQPARPQPRGAPAAPGVGGPAGDAGGGGPATGAGGSQGQGQGPAAGR